MYLDANNLYGWAMSQPLPTDGFEWVEDCGQLAGSIADHLVDSPVGYILEVDLEYPEELHDKHNAYLLAPERMVVQKEWMSEYQQELRGMSVEVIKLVSNLFDKTKYVLHYCNLQLYLSLGMRLKKVYYNHLRPSMKTAFSCCTQTRTLSYLISRQRMYSRTWPHNA